MEEAQRHITAATRCAPPFGAVLGTRGAVRGKRFRAASANSVAYAPLLRAAATLHAIALGNGGVLPPLKTGSERFTNVGYKLVLLAILLGRECHSH